MYAVRGYPAADWYPTTPPADPDTVGPAESASSDEWSVGVYAVPDGVREVAWGTGPDSGLRELRDWAR